MFFEDSQRVVSNTTRIKTFLADVTTLVTTDSQRVVSNTTRIKTRTSSSSATRVRGQRVVSNTTRIKT